LDEKWYEFDDSKVKCISEAEVKTSSAYLLFYQKRGSNSHIIEGLQEKTHWIFSLCPSLTNVNFINDLKNTKDQSSNRKYDHSLSVQNQENEEKDGGIFSRQSYVDKTSPHGGATGHISSKLVHTVSSSHTLPPEVLNTALKSKISDAQYFVNGSQMSKSTSRNGEYEYDETDSSYDVDLKVKLPPSSSMKQGNLTVDMSNRPPPPPPPSPPARSNLYDRQNAYRLTKPDKMSSNPPKIEPPVKNYSGNYANTGKYDYNTNNTSIPKPKDLPPRPQQKDISQRTYPSQKPIADSDLQRGKNKPQYEEVDSRRIISNSSPQLPKRQTTTNWSTPQPPRKNSPAHQSRTPFKRQNSIPIKSSSSSGRGNYTRLTPSKSEEDLPTQTMTKQRNNDQREKQKEAISE
jgi:hypothetical protein